LTPWGEKPAIKWLPDTGGHFFGEKLYTKFAFGGYYYVKVGRVQPLFEIRAK
jgi:hypothetical protein